MNDSLTIHHAPEPYPDTSIPDPHQDTFFKTTLGFWMYLMTDCLLFATLFATYGVLFPETFGGPSAKDIFSLPLAFTETMILLFSSVTCGFALLSAVKNNKNLVISWLGITFLLGTVFMGMEVQEFTHLASKGNNWQRSAFLSSFFTLVGTHGLHVSIGLLWIMVMAGQLLFQGITTETFRRLVIFSLFWHFLDLVWIFIFTFVYLLGVII
ncbi:MAG: cytochrome o ubiquinol oxidase subunit III [Candidatus Protochlamydia sp.]|nr:cytochrome o ubiquinol oxidase subunit III [Candidatus Protochlamydia sp.]